MSYYLYEYINYPATRQKDPKSIVLFTSQLDNLEETDLLALAQILYNPQIFKSSSRKKVCSYLRNYLQQTGLNHPIYQQKIDTILNDLLLKIPFAKTRYLSLHQLIQKVIEIKQSSPDQKEDQFNRAIESMPFKHRKTFTAIICGSLNNTNTVAVFESWLVNKYQLSVSAIDLARNFYARFLKEDNWKDFIKQLRSQKKELLPYYTIEKISKASNNQYKFSYPIKKSAQLFEYVKFNEHLLFWDIYGRLHLDNKIPPIHLMQSKNNVRILFCLEENKNTAIICTSLDYNKTFTDDENMRFIESGMELESPDHHQLLSDDKQHFILLETKEKSHFFPLMYVKGRKNIDSIVLGIYHQEKVVPFAEISKKSISKEALSSINSIAEEHTVERFGPVRLLSIMFAIKARVQSLKSNKRKKAGVEPLQTEFLNEIKPIDQINCVDTETLISQLGMPK